LSFLEKLTNIKYITGAGECVLFQDIPPPEEVNLSDSEDLPKLSNRIRRVSSKMLQLWPRDIPLSTERLVHQVCQHH